MEMIYGGKTTKIVGLLPSCANCPEASIPSAVCPGVLTPGLAAELAPGGPSATAGVVRER